MKKSHIALQTGLVALLLSACSPYYEGKYEIVSEEIEDNTVNLVVTVSEGMEDDLSVTSFTNYIKDEEGYKSDSGYDALYIQYDDSIGSEYSFYRESLTAEGEQFTGLPEGEHISTFNE